MNYIRTTEAILALQNRDRILSAKQRQLLILIGSKDFNKLSAHAKEAMCSSDIFDSLIHLGFLKKDLPIHADSLNHADDSSPTNSVPKDAITIVQPAEESKIAQESTENTPISRIHVSTTEETPAPLSSNSIPTQSTQEPVYEAYQNLALTFDNMKNLLTDTLNTHCGLMGKTHARKIESAQTVAELKRSHMTVITLLQESRMSKGELLQFTKVLQRFYQQLL
ncbi:hypothetical protein I2F17_06510 [Acinetobacter sp. B10A]|uniref:hypothetical protein n=1 Tax=Acinetobacter baretiae TaxID=2605383 RepID=UPI001B3C6E1D|nr:hypothetical protein [Acinetobacter baretiae]MBF7685470.1 hypothetical protein [Acinetobacter baretiae]